MRVILSLTVDRAAFTVEVRVLWIECDRLAEGGECAVRVALRQDRAAIVVCRRKLGIFADRGIEIRQCASEILPEHAREAARGKGLSAAYSPHALRLDDGRAVGDAVSRADLPRIAGIPGLLK